MKYPRKPLLPLLPEYDIREIPEELYMAVLACRKQMTTGI
jgi:hypothetical protein